jgi:DnaJ-class molecular chaperone
MAVDLYEILGVPKDAPADKIRSAYRKLAKTNHPDLNPGNKAAEERFKSVASAYDILSDPAKRARYDNGEIDATGAERPPPFYSQHAEGPRGQKYRYGRSFTDADDGEDFSDFFSDLFGRREAGGGPGLRMRGRDRLYSLEVPFLDAVRGTTSRLTLPDGKSMDVRIPPGIEDGQILRLKGQGGPGIGGEPAGDALIEVHILPHPFFTRSGRDILIDVPVTVAEAVLGGKISVPTPTGPVNVTVPPQSSTGTRLRLRGRGIPARGNRPAGDQYVTLKIVLDHTDDALATLLRDYKPRPDFDPRRDIMEAA